jgi:hypothetical protein
MDFFALRKGVLRMSCVFLPPAQAKDARVKVLHTAFLRNMHFGALHPIIVLATCV